jgi:hypothetical protein
MTDDYAKQLLAALRRLQRSKSPRQRLNARRAVRAAFQRTLKHYPTLDHQGRPRAEKKSGCSCPLCKLPSPDWAHLARHVLAKHWKHRLDLVTSKARQCRCCKRWFKGDTTLGSHLRALHQKGELQAHIVAGATEAIFGGAANGQG